MPTKVIQLNTTVQEPAKLGSIILKPTSGGRLSYAQNIQTTNLEYGDGVLVPGPSLVTLTNNAVLTGIPCAKVYDPVNSYILVAESEYIAGSEIGATDYLRRIEGVASGQTPDVGSDAGDSLQLTHSGHSAVKILDMTGRADGAINYAYVAGKDATDGWVQKVRIDSGTLSATTITTLSTFNVQRNIRIYRASDDIIYIFHASQVDSIDTSDVYSNSVFTLPDGYATTEVVEWNDFMAIAYNNIFTANISQRKSAGSSGVLLWNMVDTTRFEKDLYCPARYISALVKKPDGSLIAFGSLDEGLTSIYVVNISGFHEQYTYIGEPPRNRHSVDFDSRGRMIWQTIDGEICRYNFADKKFEHITSSNCSDGHAGLLCHLAGGAGNEFLVASGTDAATDTFNISRVTFGNYIGDADVAEDIYATPLAVSGLEFLPPNSTIVSITLHLTKQLATGEKITLRVYKNGSTTGSDYMDMEFAVDAAISSKKKSIPLINVSNYALGVAYKQADAHATAPPVVFAEVEWEPKIN